MILLTLSAQAQQANHEKVCSNSMKSLLRKLLFALNEKQQYLNLNSNYITQQQKKTSINYVMNYSDYIYIINRLSSVLYKQKIGICTIIK